MEEMNTGAAALNSNAMPNPVYNYNMQSAKPMPAKVPQSNVSPAMAYQMAFPEIYFKLQPYIMTVCDQLDATGAAMPTQDMLDRISDSIYDDMRTRNPDLAEYMKSQEEKANSDPVIQSARFDDPPMFGWRFRRRGLPRDLIDILLLSELFRRRRRNF